MSAVTPRVQVHRPHKGRIELAMPYDPGNRWWIEEWCGAATRPEWDGDARVWRVARKHLEAVLRGLVGRHGVVGLTLEGLRRTACTEACSGARPDTVWDCVCCCGGRGHGTGTPYSGDGPGDLVMLGVDTVIRHLLVTLGPDDVLILADCV